MKIDSRNIHLIVIAPGYISLLLTLLLYASHSMASCIKQAQTCVEGAESRLINGYSVYQECWRFASEYSCEGTSATPDSHCKELVQQGCSPVSQTCDADSCVQTYECSTGTTAVQQAVGCENQSIAINNTHFDTSYPANTDLGLVASNMAALESAVTGMIKNDMSCAESPAGSGQYVCADPILIFNGEGRKCRKDALGFNQCCNLGGWGVDAGLNQCNTEEHLLGYSRQASRAHYIGRYCTHSNVFGCYAHAYVYCDFTSRIGRIVQEQGRAQLGIGWGSAKNPNCAGFTESELATINFELIDFSEYFSEAFAAMASPPSSAEMKTIVDRYINQLQGAGCSQFDQDCVGGGH